MAENYDGPHKILVRSNKRNLGLAEHLNEIEDVAAGNIVTWCAGDDIAYPERTDVFMQELLANPGTSLVHSAVEKIDVNGNHLEFCSHKMSIRTPDPHSAVLGEGRIVTQSCAFRRADYATFGPFGESVSQEAMVMGFRSSMKKVQYIDEPLTQYRIGSGISSYNGAELSILKWTDPLTVSGWYKSSLEQMLKDINRQSITEKERIRDLIESELKYWTAVHLVNLHRNPMDGLRFIFSEFQARRELLRAIVRVSIPDWLYRLYRRI